MRKLVLMAVLIVGFVLSLSAQQNEDLFNTARRIIYGANPIGIITQINDNSLEGLTDYAMKSTDPKSVKQLSDDDAWLLSMLCFIENNRRNAENTSEFLVYLRGRTEWLDTQPMNGRTGRAAGWVQAYELLVRSQKLSVGK
ncbi:MAG: hypothetical protein LBC67_07895 [Spirochaetales bacterium]|jgi:hypothetical protein|nr:hypothetical protein [Spirochaetales bacterium]